MPTNEFVQAFDAAGSNAYSPAALAALSNISTGVLPGVADPLLYNALSRQAAVWAAVLGQIIVNNLGVNADDDNTTATLITNIQAAFAAGVPHGRSVFNPGASGNFTVPNGVSSIRVIGWAGGGGSGGCNSTATSGGGGGGGVFDDVIAVTSGQVIAYSVGTGGAAGNTTPTSGGTGGSTVFGTRTATGGVGSPGQSGGAIGSGGAGGTVTGASNFWPGVAGGAGLNLNVTPGCGGGGGGAMYSPAPTVTNQLSTGTAGVLPGSGASGTSNSGNGAAGAGGLLIITW
jgi:hypothetical protein